MPTALEKILKHMVEKSDDGVFYGSPRSQMERTGTSSGPLYAGLKKMGLVRYGHGKNSRWRIPKTVIDQYKKE